MTAAEFVPAAPYFTPTQLDDQRPSRATSFLSLNYATPDGYRPLELDLYIPESATTAPACVIWMHGGGWMNGSRLHPPLEWPAGSLFQLCIDAGLAVASIDYRHAREAAFPAQLHDAKSAVRYLRTFATQLGIDPELVGVWGESAGGHLAALVGLVSAHPELEGSVGIATGDSSVSVVVDYYGPSDFETFDDQATASAAAKGTGVATPTAPPVQGRDGAAGPGGAPAEDPVPVLLGGTDAAARRFASPVTYVTPTAPQFLLVHGEEDSVVPVAQSLELADALTAAGVTVALDLIPAADHVFVGTDPLIPLRRSVDYLAAALRPPGK